MLRKIFRLLMISGSYIFLSGSSPVLSGRLFCEFLGPESRDWLPKPKTASRIIDTCHAQAVEDKQEKKKAYQSYISLHVWIIDHDYLAQRNSRQHLQISRQSFA
jgi:hypothetical protein